MSSHPGSAQDGSDGPSPPYTAMSNGSSGFNMFAFLPPTSSQGRREDADFAYPGESRQQTSRTDMPPTGITLESRDFPVTPPSAVPLEHLTAYLGGVPPPGSLPGTASVPMTAWTGPPVTAPARTVSGIPSYREQNTAESIPQPVSQTPHQVSTRSALDSSGVVTLDYTQDSVPSSASDAAGEKSDSVAESGGEKDPEK